MTAKRGSTGLSGILLVDKPAGLTSHDVVARIRRVTGERRIGHAGTLDPAATGLLVVLIGPYTRLEPYLSAACKSYEATIALGAQTDTDDAEGEIIARAPVPAEALDEAAVRRVLAGVLGESLQVPPRYSAIKVGGHTAHRVARAGGTLEVAPRPIQVLDADLLGITTDPPAWTVAFTVSKGTYIRALARDLGRGIGSAAHLAGLRRTRSGALQVEDATPLDDLVRATQDDPGSLVNRFTDAVAAVGLPSIEGDLGAVTAGRPLPLPAECPERVSVTHGGTLIAIYRRSGDTLVADAVFPVLEEMRS